MTKELKEAISRIEQEMKSLDGSISNKYWIIQGLHKAWEICHKVEDESKQSKQILELNNSFDLLKKFKIYYDKVDGNIIFSDSHHERIVGGFITEEINNIGKNE